MITKNQTQAEKIVEHMKKNSMSEISIAQASQVTGLKSIPAGNVLNRAAKRNVLKRIGNGIYALPNSTVTAVYKPRIVNEEIDEDMLQKYTFALNEIRKVLETVRKSQSVKVAKTMKQNHVNVMTIDALLRCGFTGVRDYGYACHVAVFEPIHARKVILTLRTMSKEAAQRAKERAEAEEKTLRKESKKAQVKLSNEKPVEEKSSAKGKRTFSILWGLIKFNY